MKNCKDTILRSVVKTFFFKVITTAITAYFTGVGAAIGIHLILTLVYLIYERVWNKIQWGRITSDGEDIPIQFTKWLNDNYGLEAEQDDFTNDFSDEKTYRRLYDHWFKNVYNPQPS